MLHFSFLLLKAGFFFLFCLVLAGIEVEAEGKCGWAEKMPTWYRTRGLAAKIYMKILGGRPLTGYHSFMFIFPLLIFHVQFFMGLAWSLKGELVSLAMYFVAMCLWDFLWFILNPHYKWEKFKPQNIWWHSKSPWVGGLPLDYFISWGISILFAALAGWVASNFNVLTDHLLLLLLLFLFTVITIFFSPYYHKWYWRMRKEDDRSSAGIFHTLPDPGVGCGKNQNQNKN
ncbi:MAG: hypothetical protein ACOZAR_02150 [Patescibacteria group bacterium]